MYIIWNSHVHVHNNLHNIKVIKNLSYSISREREREEREGGREEGERGERMIKEGKGGGDGREKGPRKIKGNQTKQ